jgi:acyl-homoserine lactone acylase PvdQ
MASLWTACAASAQPGTAIRIDRDAVGVPHITSPTDAGAFFGLGYAVAQDRLYQMLWLRARIYGRLAEFYGAGTDNEHINHDIDMRLHGWRQYALGAVALMDVEARAMLEAYAAGVSRWITTPNRPLSEMHSLRPLPLNEPWTAADCVAIWTELGLNYSNGVGREVETAASVRAGRALGRTTEQLAQELWSNARSDDDSGIVQTHHVHMSRQDAMLSYAVGLDVPQLSPGAGDVPAFSDAIAIRGVATQTGGAILLGEPRILVVSPNLLHEWHMVGATLNVRGASLPGTPNLLSGSTNQVAWSPTSVGVDQADVFEIQIVRSGQSVVGYALDGATAPFTDVRREVIQVAGGSPRTVFHRRTRFGPIITDIDSAPAPSAVLAIKRLPLSHPERDTSGGFLSIYRSPSIAAFDVNLVGWSFPPVHLVFAAVDGNIGYRLAGAMPIRTRREAFAPYMAMEGTRSDNDWIEIVPHSLMPSFINPAEGFVTANNQLPAASWYPLRWLVQGGGHTHRSYSCKSRLQELLANGHRVTSADAEELRRDTVPQFAVNMVFIGQEMATRGLLRPSGLSILPPLLAWVQSGARLDGSHYGALLAFHLPRVLRLEPAQSTYGGGASGMCAFVRTIANRLRQPTPVLPSTADTQIINELFALAVSAVNGELGLTGSSLGGTPLAWTAKFNEKLHTEVVRWRSPRRETAALLGDTISVGPLTAAGPVVHDSVHMLWSQLVEFAPTQEPPPRVRTMLALGQSEAAASPHFLDQQEIWRTGQLKNSPEPITGSTVIQW